MKSHPRPPRDDYDEDLARIAQLEAEVAALMAKNKNGQWDFAIREKLKMIEGMKWVKENIR